ncbi:GNAT family N-acetyltransferase [Streptomyces sp. CA-249302]|uniref:GNAT family N-acetyltransferase n=1 Tax=Streptomyces sp. CA-249302 TaxID=3240058 RepID=UPI003D8F55B6
MRYAPMQLRLETARLILREWGDSDVADHRALVGGATVAEPEIAYELFRRAHGQGYATEAATAVLDAATATGRTRLWEHPPTWALARDEGKRLSSERFRYIVEASRQINDGME